METRKEEQNAIDASGGNCEEIKQYVKSWLAEVNEIMGKAKDLVIEDDRFLLDTAELEATASAK